MIAVYFYLGGISGSAAVIAAFARLSGGATGAHTARLATYLSIAALAPCPVLLILDLGRPGRFLNMLRVFRPSSPMSIGSWGLVLFGLISSIVSAVQLWIDLRASEGMAPARLPRWTILALTPFQAISGFFVAGYTGVLLAATAVPLWSKQPGILGPLFLASAMTSGSAAVATASALTTRDEEHVERVRRLEVVATLAEATLLAAWIGRLGQTANPITRGDLGSVVTFGVIGTGMAVPMTMAAFLPSLPRRLRRPAVIASSLLTLAGVLALRFAVVEGGRRSADDPRAVFDMTS